MPQYLPAGFTQYVLNGYSTKSPPYHVTTDNVTEQPLRLAVSHIYGHQITRGPGGKIAVMYKTHWQGLRRASWERESDLQLHRRAILLYWTQSPQQQLADNKGYRNMRRGAAARELHRDKGLRFVADGYELVPTKQWDDKFRAKDKPPPKGAYLWYKGSDHLWWLGQIHSIDVLEADTYIVRFLDDPGPVQLKLRPDSYTTSPSAPRGSWCLQRSKSHGLRRGLQRNVDRTHDVHAPS